MENQTNQVFSNHGYIKQKIKIFQSKFGIQIPNTYFLQL
jgi:hypothetical protein